MRIICRFWAVLGVYGVGVCDWRSLKLVGGMVYVDTLFTCMRCTRCILRIQYSMQYSMIECVFESSYTVVMNAYSMGACPVLQCCRHYREILYRCDDLITELIILSVVRLQYVRVPDESYQRQQDM